MQVQMTSDKDIVLDVAPYNNHTLNCTVSLESFEHDNGTLFYSFIKEGVTLHEQNKIISTPGPFTALYTASESLEGISYHTCKVTLKVKKAMVTSAMNGTVVKVVGKWCSAVACDLHIPQCPSLNVIGPKPPALPILSNVITSTTDATVSWTVPEITYTAENYTVYYGSDGSCSLNDVDLEKLSQSITTYTSNNQTLAEFFFEKDLNLSIQVFGLVPSAHYCCL